MKKKFLQGFLVVFPKTPLKGEKKIKMRVDTCIMQDRHVSRHRMHMCGRNDGGLQRKRRSPAVRDAAWSTAKTPLHHTRPSRPTSRQREIEKRRRRSRVTLCLPPAEKQR